LAQIEPELQSKPHAAVMLDCLGALQKKTLAANKTTCCPFFKSMLDCRGQKCVDYASVAAKAAWDLTGEGNTWAKALKGMPMFKEQSAACDGISVLGSEEEVVAMIATMKAALPKKTTATETTDSGTEKAAPKAAAATKAPATTTKAPTAVADFAAQAQSAPIMAMVAAITMSVTANELL
jgi:hypothetical protein